MLLAKINPPAEKIIEITPFSSTTILLDYMTAIARPYSAGATKTNFVIEFGNITENEDIVTSFQSKTQTRLTLTSEELDTWGTNDEDLLVIVADKLGVTIEEFKSLDRD
jgi:hypothetical protein